MIVLHRTWQEPGNDRDLFAAVGIYLQADGDMEIDWTEDDVSSLRDDLMKKSLAQVDDPRVGPTTLKDIERWVDDETDRPFSFLDCVRPYAARFGFGIHDALEVVRLEFKSHLRARADHRALPETVAA